jgi:Rrf2 family iron-sulfur cluster assembly transcriptional regulator
MLFGGAMRLTRAGEYAVRCVLHLASKGPGTLCALREVAERMDIPDQFLGKIAQQLARAGLIEIVQGARGGLRLVVPPDQVTLLEVVEAVIGEIFLNDCVMRPESCDRSHACAVHCVWAKAKDQLRRTLEDATFSRLLKENDCGACATGTAPSRPRRRATRHVKGVE